MTKQFRLSTFAALAAGASLLATPAAALDLPNRSRAEIATGVADQAGWGHHGRRHRGGIDAGDVIAGVLVIGAIAAIAGAADNSRDDDRRREARYPEPDYRPQPDYRPDPRAPMRGDYQSSRGIDSAVAMCVDQVERGSDRVESVDNAQRTADGWRVSGSLGDGAGWNCWIDNDGRIREVDLAGQGSGYSSAAVAGRQLSDEEYARARAAQRGNVAQQAAPQAAGQGEPQPAYPGGPLPGEEGYDEAMRLGSAG